MTIAFDDLRPGLYFTYRGPARLQISRGVATGQILACDALAGAVLVRTLFRIEQDKPRLVPEIGFLPLLYSAFLRSRAKLVVAGDLPEDTIRLTQFWRQRRLEGIAGAFSLELWKAERKAWETVWDIVPNANRETFFIEYAFPIAGSDDSYAVVEVSAAPRLQS